MHVPAQTQGYWEREREMERGERKIYRERERKIVKERERDTHTQTDRQRGLGTSCPTHPSTHACLPRNPKHGCSDRLLLLREQSRDYHVKTLRHFERVQVSGRWVMEMAPAVINLTQKPQTKVNPTARFPLREALRLHEQKVLYREARTIMAHRSVKKKEKRTNLKSSSSSYQGESGRLWKTKSTSRQWSSSLFTKKITSSNTLQHCSASGPRGPTDTTRLTHVRRTSAKIRRLESRRTVKPDHGVRTRVPGCCHVIGCYAKGGGQTDNR